MSGPLLQVNISAGYGKTTTLQNVSFTLNAGDRAGLVGTSGAGKSTLVLALMGMLPWRKGWVRGEVLLEGQNLLRCTERELRQLRGNRVALIPQSPAAALNPALTLQTHFDEVWRAHSLRGSNASERVSNLLQRVDLPCDTAFLRRYPAQISVGQAQRIMIALALLHKPKLLIADEPTSALDVCTQQEIVHLLHGISQEEGTTLLYVTHDLVSVLQLCERMLVMSHGALVDSLDLSLQEVTAVNTISRKLLQTLPVPAATVRQSFLSRMAGCAPVLTFA